MVKNNSHLKKTEAFYRMEHPKILLCVTLKPIQMVAIPTAIISNDHLLIIIQIFKDWPNQSISYQYRFWFFREELRIGSFY